MEFKKYKKIKQLGHEDNKDIFADSRDNIYKEEKMDGANFRFMTTEEGIRFGSRASELFEDGDHKYQKNFTRCILYIKDKLKDVKFDKNLAHYLFYGENMIKHSMDYDWDKIPPYLGFDVYDLKNECFVDHDTKVVLFNKLGLEMVPFLGVCKASDIKQVTDKDVPVSKYRLGDGKAEGVVFKNYTKQIYAKYVTDNFKEVNAKTFGGVAKYGEDDGAKFVHKYCTNPRIDKCIFKLIDDGNKLEMSLMKLLPKMVNKDIWEENWQDIYSSKRKLDFHRVHKLITKRCLYVLKQVITNNAFENEGSAETN